MFNLFGSKVKKAIKSGAVIIDLRAAGAFDQGRIPGSINIPVDRLAINLGKIKSFKRPIVLCSSQTSDIDKATRLLRSEGIGNIINGGNWESLLAKVKRW